MATNTYVALDKVTANGSVSSITFSSIASTYTDLVLVIQGANSNVSNARWKLNGDTGTNYSWTGLGGTGSSAVSTRIANTSTPQLDWYGYFDSNQSNLITHFMNYSNTTTFKTVLTRSNNAANGVAATVGLWRNTAAITTIEIVSSNGNWNSGSTFSLYGIAAEGIAAKATGGAIYSDSTYWYHVFGSTGTFTPNQSLSADVLVVAGGGGGAHGGGGAGGLLAFTGQSLTATGYTVTVGGGGAGSSGTIKGTTGNDSQFSALTLVKGGGGAGVSGSFTPTRRDGLTGGSGGGGAPDGASVGTGGSATSGQGNAGGNSGTGAGTYPGGGGGGAGAVGGTGVNGTGGGVGGIGSSTYSSWGVATGVGQNVSGTYYLAGGGGAGSDNGGAAGGLGGGGAGASGTSTAGLAFTGGGGGGSSNAGSASANGGSGVVIVRYAK